MAISGKLETSIFEIARKIWNQKWLNNIGTISAWRLLQLLHSMNFDLHNCSIAHQLNKRRHTTIYMIGMIWKATEKINLSIYTILNLHNSFIFVYFACWEAMRLIHLTMNICCKRWKGTTKIEIEIKQKFVIHKAQQIGRYIGARLSFFVRLIVITTFYIYSSCRFYVLRNAQQIDWCLLVCCFFYQFG